MLLDASTLVKFDWIPLENDKALFANTVYAADIYDEAPLEDTLIGEVYKATVLPTLLLLIKTRPHWFG